MLLICWTIPEKLEFSWLGLSNVGAERWSSNTRNWGSINEVCLNPPKEKHVKEPKRLRYDSISDATTSLTNTESSALPFALWGVEAGDGVECRTKNLQKSLLHWICCDKEWG